jgi:hypothetical protein
LRSALLSIASLMFCALPTAAQLSRRLDRCLPYPTLADEISNMHQEVESKTAAMAGVAALPATVVIDNVKFDPPIHLGDESNSFPI